MTTKIHEEGEGGGAGAAGATTTGSVGNTPGTDTGWGVNPPKKKIARRKVSMKEFLEINSSQVTESDATHIMTHDVMHRSGILARGTVLQKVHGSKKLYRVLAGRHAETIKSIDPEHVKPITEQELEEAIKGWKHAHSDIMKARADAHHEAMEVHDAAHRFGAKHGIHSQNTQGWEHSVSSDSYRSAALRANESEELPKSDVIAEQHDHIFLGAKVQPKHAVDKNKPFVVHRIVSDDTAEVKDEYGNKQKMHFSDLAPHHEDDDDEEAERRRKFQAAMRAVGDSAKGMPGLGFKGGTYNPQKHRKEGESVEGEIVESELHRAVSSGMKDLLHSGDHATFKKVAAHLGHPEWQTNPSESDLKSCSTPKLQKAHDHMYKGHPLSESVDMISEVEVQGSERYEYTHGKKPKGFGNWYFSKHKSIDFGAHKEGEDHVSIRGTYGEAKKQATAWAKSKGHAVIHVQT